MHYEKNKFFGLGDLHRAARFLAAMLLFCFTASMSMAGPQAAPGGPYSYRDKYRYSKDLNDPAVPARAAAVIGFIRGLGYTPRSYSGLGFTWRWKKSPKAADGFEFNEGRFAAYSSSAPEGARGINVFIYQGIEDPGFEIVPVHGGSTAMTDGSSHPGRESFLQLGAGGQRLPERFVPLEGKSGIWLGYANSGPRGVLSCGAVSIEATGDTSVVNLTPQAQLTEIESYHSFITTYLTGLQAKLCASGLCRCVAAAPPIELLDGNPAHFKVQNGEKLFDFTDPKAVRFFLDREDWIRGAQLKAVQARETRKGAAADGVSLLILRSEVPSGGKAVFKLPGGTADGTLYRITDVAPLGQGKAEVEVSIFEDDDAGRLRHWALALYLPPKAFGRGVGARLIKVELTSTSRSGTVSQGAGEIRLIRPPVVLVHGTFDNPKACWDPEPKDCIPEAVTTMKKHLVNEGFRVFLMDWGETSGQMNPSSFYHNRKVVWENPGGIKEALQTLRKENFAVTQVDIVAHSQGGLLARIYARGSWVLDRLPDDDFHYTSPRDCAETCGYHRTDNFASGDIHRLITISTTHYGSDVSGLFNIYAKLIDSKRLINDPIMSFGEAVKTELLLSMHPQREIKVVDPFQFFPLFNLFRGNASELKTIDLGEAKMFLDGLWQKVPGFKNYTFTEGVRDQVPGNSELKKIGKTRIPAHAIACMADNQAVLTLNTGYYQRRMEKVWGYSSPGVLEKAFQELGQPDDAADLRQRKKEEDVLALQADNLYAKPEVLNRLQKHIRLNSARLRSAVFGNSANDCTVRKESSLGGLKDPYITVLPGVLHGPAPQFPSVQNRVVELLENDGSLFDPNGFPVAGILPPNQQYSGPPAPDEKTDVTSDKLDSERPGLRKGVEEPTRPNIPKTEEPTEPQVMEPKEDTALDKEKPTMPRAEEKMETKEAGVAVLKADGTLQLSVLGCRLRREGDQFVVQTAEAPLPGMPNMLKTGAMLTSIFDVVDNYERELPIAGLSLADLAHLLNSMPANAPITFRFSLPDGETRDIQLLLPPR